MFMCLVSINDKMLDHNLFMYRTSALPYAKAGTEELSLAIEIHTGSLAASGPLALPAISPPLIILAPEREVITWTSWL